MILKKKSGKNGMKGIVGICLVFLFLTVLPALALAEGEQQSEEGTSGSKPLSFVSAEIVGGGNLEGASNVLTQPKFKLTFDKNVVNASVWENNTKCFTLTSASGQSVPVLVIKVDDTVDMNQRHYITIQPKVLLAAGTSYQLKISPNLMSKNTQTLAGTTGGKGVTISFKTAGSPPSSGSSQSGGASGGSKSAASAGSTSSGGDTSTSTNAESGSDQPADTAANPEEAAQSSEETLTAGSTAGKSKKGDDSEKAALGDSESDQGTASSGLLSWKTILFLALITGLVLFEVLVRRRKKKAQMAEEMIAAELAKSEEAK
jgi:hypothetical protein